jgi:RNA polymerase sigma-70 factor, ECF subfamily
MLGIAQQITLQELPLAQEQRTATRDDLLTALVGRQSRFVFRVAYSILRNIQDSDDVVQETFLKLYRSHAWERMANEKAYLARIAWRIAVSQLRKAPANPLGDDTASTAQSPEHAAIVSDWNSAVCRVIDALPEELRQPLALSGIGELNSRQISKVMGIPEGTVRTRLARARQILKQKLHVLRAGPYEKR